MKEAFIYAFIYCAIAVWVLCRFDKSYKKQMREIKRAGMKSDTAIEICEMEVPEQNPNPVNDIYKSDVIGDKREVVIQCGTPYPAVITKVEAVLIRGQKGVKYPAYEVTIRYGENREFLLRRVGITKDPRVILENPYCTVYEYNKRMLATNFKVKPCYISGKGKLQEEPYLSLKREKMILDLEEKERARKTVESLRKQREYEERKKIRQLQKEMKDRK